MQLTLVCHFRQHSAHFWCSTLTCSRFGFCSVAGPLLELELMSSWTLTSRPPACSHLTDHPACTHSTDKAHHKHPSQHVQLLTLVAEGEWWYNGSGWLPCFGVTSVGGKDQCMIWEQSLWCVSQWYGGNICANVGSLRSENGVFWSQRRPPIYSLLFGIHW